VLRSVVARAGAGLNPGRLLGSIDRIAAPWTIEGWACDADHPELPVLLEIQLENRVIGTVLACEGRADLEKAGIGSGRCAFFLTSPVRLRPDSLDSVRVRRATDQIDLCISNACAAGIDPIEDLSAIPRLRLLG
jgi:hypothetical protein